MSILLQSVGIKRLVASVLSVLVEALKVIPGTEFIRAIIDIVAGLFGITGVAHAQVTGDIDKKKLVTASACLSVLVAVCTNVQSLQPLVPALQKAAGLIGAAALGVHLSQNEKGKTANETVSKPTGGRPS